MNAERSAPMIIKLVDEEHIIKAKNVIMYCFNKISEQKIDWILNNELKQGNCIGAFHNNEIAGCAVIYPYQIHFESRRVGMGAVGLVSTLPEYRNQRFAANMMIEALKLMREREQYFAILGAFSIDYYRKLGWEICFEMKHYHLKMDHLKEFGSSKGAFRPLTEQDRASVNQIFNRFTSLYNGTAIGEDRHWYRRHPSIMDSQIRYGLFDENDMLQGYIYFTIEDRVLFVKEMIYSSLSAKKELLHFIYRHRAQASDVDWIAPPDDNTFLMIENPKDSLNKTITGKMLRVVDVERVLELMTFDDHDHVTFTIKVDDPWLSWNNQIFSVSVNKGKAIVRVIDPIKADLECTIQVFSQISMGYISLKEAVELDKILINNNKMILEIEKLFPRKPTYINEQF
jgi:predicted acetyltransferase